MPQGLAARILGILDGLINPKSYTPPITRGDLIKYDDSITFDGLNSVGPIDGLGNQFGVGGRIENQTLYLQGANNDLGTPRAGLMTTGTQTISGQKTFNGNLSVNGIFYAKSIISTYPGTALFETIGQSQNSTVYIFTNTGSITVTINNGGSGYNATYINAGGGTITFVANVGTNIISENNWTKNNVINTAVTATNIDGINTLLTGKLSA